MHTLPSSAFAHTWYVPAASAVAKEPLDGIGVTVFAPVEPVTSSSPLAHASSGAGQGPAAHDTDAVP
jgi:hypothetical protein